MSDEENTVTIEDSFEEFGFEIEPFGEHEVILRAVPADILLDDALPALEEILEHLENGNAPDPRSARDELLHTVACKAAIKAGWNTGMAELERITREVLSGRGQMSGQVSRGSAGECQADEWAGIARTSWRLSVR